MAEGLLKCKMRQIFKTRVKAEDADVEILQAGGGDSEQKRRARARSLALQARRSSSGGGAGSVSNNLLQVSQKYYRITSPHFSINPETNYKVDFKHNPSKVTSQMLSRNYSQYFFWDADSTKRASQQAEKAASKAIDEPQIVELIDVDDYRPEETRKKTHRYYDSIDPDKSRFHCVFCLGLDHPKELCRSSYEFINFFRKDSSSVVEPQNRLHLPGECSSRKALIGPAISQMKCLTCGARGLGHSFCRVEPFSIEDNVYTPESVLRYSRLSQGLLQVEAQEPELC